MPRKVNSCDMCSKSYSSKFLKQCLKCSRDGQVFVCDQCSPSHTHFSEDDQASASKKDDKKAFDTPLHTQDDLLQEFSTALNLLPKQAKELSTINQIKRVDMESKDGKVIVEYFKNSLVNKPNAQIVNIWSVNNKMQDKKFDKKKLDTSNNMLLWNGTLYDNITSLLNSGFQIPSQHDRTKMKAKFIFFNDRIMEDAVVKAGQNEHAIILLSEVCLGKVKVTPGVGYTVLNIVTHHNPNDEWHTMKMLGKNAPDDGNVKFIGKAKVPLGKSFHKKSWLDLAYDYNQYMVFDSNRINIKYIVLYKMN